jgi:hypothetical protein
VYFYRRDPIIKTFAISAALEGLALAATWLPPPPQAPGNNFKGLVLKRIVCIEKCTPLPSHPPSRDMATRPEL